MDLLFEAIRMLFYSDNYIAQVIIFYIWYAIIFMIVRLSVGNDTIASLLAFVITVTLFGMMSIVIGVSWLVPILLPIGLAIVLLIYRIFKSFVAD